PADVAETSLIERHEIYPVKIDGPIRDGPVFRQIADHGERDGRLPRPGLTHEPEGLITMERKADLAHGLKLHSLDIVRDGKILNFQDGSPFGHPLRPSARKLMATTSDPIANEGKRTIAGATR